MSRNFAHRLAAAISVTAWLAISSAVHAERPEVGAVTRTQNEVKAVYEARERPLAVNSALLFEDFVTTGEKARLEAVLEDDTKISLGENAELLIDEFVYEPGQGKGSLTMMVLEGAFLFVGGKIEELLKPIVTIVTPAAVLGVRGTSVWGGNIDGAFGILCLDGEVEVLTDRGAVSLTPKQGTMIFAGKKPSDPIIWKKGKVERALAMTGFED